MVDISLPKSVKSVNEQNAPKFYCACCDYTASKKHHLRKHLGTDLHKTRQEATPKVKKCKCSFCFKTFKSRQGRWKHEKKCSNNPKILKKELEEYKLSANKKLEEAKKKIENLEKKHVETLESQLKIQNELLLKQKTAQTQNINTQNNNYINIQLYLDEKCKNAMPIMDFIKDLQFKLTDINPERPASTIESLSKCITDKLEDMDETERPVHCSDAKRLVFHVKDASGWTKDINNKKIDKAIGWANMRHQGAWIKKATSEDLVNQKDDLDFLHMNVAMGKFSDDPQKAKRKVKRAIAKAVPLKLNKTIQ